VSYVPAIRRRFVSAVGAAHAELHVGRVPPLHRGRGGAACAGAVIAVQSVHAITCQNPCTTANSYQCWNSNDSAFTSDVSYRR
jgi:hypothetical protein